MLHLHRGETSLRFGGREHPQHRSLRSVDDPFHPREYIARKISKIRHFQIADPARTVNVWMTNRQHYPIGHLSKSHSENVGLKPVLCLKSCATRKSNRWTHSIKSLCSAVPRTT